MHRTWSKYTTVNVANNQIHVGQPKVLFKFFVNQFLCFKSLIMKFVLRDLIAETISAVFFFSSKVDKMWVVAMLDFSNEFCSFLALRIKNKDIIIFEVIRKTALIYSWRGGGNSLEEWNKSVWLVNSFYFTHNTNKCTFEVSHLFYCLSSFVCWTFATF